MKFTKDTPLAYVLGDPKKEKILSKYNLPCLGCPYAQEEKEELKLGQICEMYGIKLEALLEDLNKL